jgi:ABC-type bacteriocin/lantibiotic exporter with double-glycine peptidase domain
VPIKFLSPLKVLREDQILVDTDLQKVRISINVGILGSVAELFALMCSIPLLESIAETENPIAGRFIKQFGSDDEKRVLVFSLILFLIGQICRFSTLYVKTRTNAKNKRLLAERVGSAVYSSYLSLDNKNMAFENSSANSQNVINTNSYINYRVFSIVSLTTELFTLILLIVAMCAYSPLFILPVISLSGIAALVVFKSTIRKVKIFGELVAKETKIRNRILNESLRNLDEIQIFGNQNYFNSMFRVTNHSVLTGEQRYEEITTFAPVAIEISAICVFSIVFGIQIAGDFSTSTLLATIGILFVGALRIIPSLGKIVSELQKQGYGLEARLAIQRDINNDEDSSKAFPVGVKTEIGIGSLEKVSIQVVDLEFRYSNRNISVINDLSFCLDKEILFGIKGRSGSGKSTLLRLLLGIYKPSSGNIYLNGMQINSDLIKWRSQIGYVPQSVFFIDGTVRENIVFGGLESQTFEVFECLKKVGLESFIAGLPNGLETHIGEGGELFSGGQRQRIGIARALYRKPTILVLDEPTSALDMHATAEITKMLKHLSKDVIVIVASHDEYILSECDEVIDLDNR